MKYIVGFLYNFFLSFFSFSMCSILSTDLLLPPPFVLPFSLWENRRKKKGVSSLNDPFHIGFSNSLFLHKSSIFRGFCFLGFVLPSFLCWIWMGLEVGVVLVALPTQRILGDWGMFPQVCSIFDSNLVFFFLPFSSMGVFFRVLWFSLVL